MDLERALKALSNVTRLQIFDMLMEGVQCNCEIAERLGLAINLISYHLRALQAAGLVESERDPDDARWIYYSVSRVALEDIRQQLGVLLDPQRIQPRTPSCGPKGACARR